MRAAMFILVAALAFPFADTRADDPPKGRDFVGRIEAVAAVDLRGRVTGYLIRVAVKEGATVAKGELLVEIDPRPYRLDLDAAMARMKVAEAKAQAAKLTTGNSKKLAQGKIVSPGEVALHEAAEAQAQAGLAAAKVDAQRAQLNLSFTRITAPLDGRVSRLPATEGDLVIADQTHVLTVARTDPLYVSFNVPEGMLLQLRRDGLAAPSKLDVAVGFAGEEGHPHAAKLDVIAPELDPNTGTARFRATVPNPKGLLSPGMSARVRLTPANR